MSKLKYNITEIFKSIQGEGFYTGIPAVFVRFFGCNLNCSWCDSPDSRAGTRKKKLFKTYTIDTLCDKLDPNYRTVVLTGGEPLIQPEIPALVRQLSSAYNIHIETNGTQLETMKELHKDKLSWITISPKFEQLPTDEAFWYADEIKWIVTQKDVTAIINKTLVLYEKGVLKPHRMFLQPEWFDSNTVSICMGMIDLYPTIFRLSYQIHKVLNIR